jgi:hypothetical protein
MTIIPGGIEGAQRFLELSVTADLTHMAELNQLRELGALVVPGEGYILAVTPEAEQISLDIIPTLSQDATFVEAHKNSQLTQAGFVTNLVYRQENNVNMPYEFSEDVLAILSGFAIFPSK